MIDLFKLRLGSSTRDGFHGPLLYSRLRTLRLTHIQAKQYIDAESLEVHYFYISTSRYGIYQFYRRSAACNKDRNSQHVSLKRDPQMTTSRTHYRDHKTLIRQPYYFVLHSTELELRSGVPESSITAMSTFRSFDADCI
ncbi:Protein of unknown function [Pyronema omphalodes CBS 100304]|uniref:Uncharacterized protein n=1 Tax=Pyronema omphalodes (strain CBS 100304) TaxID=1076935 RepID=U4L395_PYROM|nr:Protein of unknown function [Pyronema omphalodes CBS 100304]